MGKILKFLVFFILTFVIPLRSWSCTIFCAKDDHGHVWTGNNEDFYFFDFTTQITISPKSDSTQAYFFFHYNNDFPQGGVNESGLFFDGNAVESSEKKGFDLKEPFPGKIFNVLTFVLERCKSVPEIIEIFSKYKIPWMQGAQLHFSDRLGNFGIITADSSWLSNGKFQVSTNYDLSHDDDDYKKCWRYPIAHSILNKANPGFELFSSICDSTSQRKDAFTIYSNVHNLSTGEMWLYYGWDYENPYKTTFNDMIALGDTTFLIRKLFVNQPLVKAYESFLLEGFGVGLEIINSIVDSSLREEKLKLFTLGILFELDQADGNLVFSKDDNLVSQVIEATKNTNVLSIIANQNISKSNRESVNNKLRSIDKSVNEASIIYITFIVGIFVVLLAIVWNWRNKRHLTNAKNP